MESANKRKTKSALSVAKGIEKPSSTNIEAIKRFKKIKREKYSVDEMVDGIVKGNRAMLSKAITLVESNLPEHQQISQEIIDKCIPFSGESIRIGITGVPGVGKSTFIEVLGKYLTSRRHKVGVLAIDPSSGQSKGSILGDKTRMEALSSDSRAYIRPSPSAGSLGGVARKTRQTIILCEAAGFDVILIETVGVGQSEIAVHSMVDFFLLLMLAGAGDELQGIKRGIMEMADLIAITKADSGNEQNAERAKSEYFTAVHLFPKSKSGWQTQVLTCSSKQKEGIAAIWDNMLDYRSFVRRNGFFAQKRKEQSMYWMHEAIEERLRNDFYNSPGMKENIQKYEQMVTNGKISSFHAAMDLLNMFSKK